MKKTVLLFILFWGLGVSGLQADEVKALLMRLESKMAGVDTIETDFIQEKRLAVFHQPVILKGKIFIKKPDFFSWHVREPLQYTMLIRDGLMKQWDGDSNQVQQFSLSGNPGFSMAIEQMKVWFSGAYSSLLKDYRATIISENPVVLEFVPMESNPACGLIRSVRMLFEEDERYLSGIIIEEKSGDSTTLKFSSVKLNMPMDRSAWELRRDVR
ncbi:MAG: outer membrane lipoprotein carrier protein LolA [Candidatus Omnitrophota bacterium]